MNDPQISVVIPTYNRSEFLLRAIGSVLNQKFKGFEVIVVDDCSPDDTEGIVSGFESAPVRYLRHRNNRGVAAARNSGVAAAKADWVAFLDDDDMYLPGFLRGTWTVASTAPPQVGLSWCGIRWVDESGPQPQLIREEIWRPSYKNREGAYLGFLRNRRVGANCGLSVRKSAFEEVGGFDEDFRGGAEDTDFLIRMVRRFDFRVVPRVLVQGNLHANESLRGLVLEKARGYERIMTKHSATLGAHPELAADLLYKTGWLAFHSGDAERGRKRLFSAVRKKPRHWKAWMLLILFGLPRGWAVRLHRWVSSGFGARSTLHAARKDATEGSTPQGS